MRVEKEKGKDFAFKDTYGKSARKQGALQERKFNYTTSKAQVALKVHHSLSTRSSSYP
jgi:hypothetical protein